MHHKLIVFLNLEIIISKEGSIVNQINYTLELIEDTCYLRAKSSIIPLNPTNKPSPNDDIPLEDHTYYRRIIILIIEESLEDFSTSPTLNLIFIFL